MVYIILELLFYTLLYNTVCLWRKSMGFLHLEPNRVGTRWSTFMSCQPIGGIIRMNSVRVWLYLFICGSQTLPELLGRSQQSFVCFVQPVIQIFTKSDTLETQNFNAASLPSFSGDLSTTLVVLSMIIMLSLNIRICIASNLNQMPTLWSCDYVPKSGLLVFSKSGILWMLINSHIFKEALRMTWLI